MKLVQVFQENINFKSQLSVQFYSVNYLRILNLTNRNFSANNFLSRSAKDQKNVSNLSSNIITDILESYELLKFRFDSSNKLMMIATP